MIRNLVGGEEQACTHCPTELPTPRADACEECGSTWNLRMCATCGHVGCCDSQAGDARRHFQEAGHEVMVAMPIDQGFRWCYVDDRYLS
jgi:uncharacterized UBP type Zn finger protein